MKPHGREAAIRLAVLAAASLAIYYVAMVRPFGLPEWWNLHRYEIPAMVPDAMRGIADYGFSILALFILYALALRVASGLHGSWSWVAVMGGAVAFNAVMLATYPFSSVDVFEYIIRGRILAYHGGNPFYQTPVEFPSDPFFPYAAWLWAPSAYGPIWELLAGGVTRLAGDGIVANLVAFKLMGVLAAGATTLLIYLMLAEKAPERALRGVALFSWNPLLVVETAGNGHNDIVMALFIILGFYLLARGRLSLAVLALVVGGLIKFMSLLLIPVVVVAAVKRIKGWSNRLSYLLMTGGASLLLILAFYVPFWDGGEITELLGVERRGELFTTSLPTLILGWVAEQMDAADAMTMVSRGALLVTMIWVAWQTVATWRSDDEDAPVRAGFSILLVYLLVTVLWFFPWYLIWPLALAALLPGGLTQTGLLLFTLSASWKPALTHIGYRVVPESLEWSWIPSEWPITLGVMGLPWAYFLYQAVRAGLRRIPSPRSRGISAAEDRDGDDGQVGRSRREQRAPASGPAPIASPSIGRQDRSRL